MKQLKLFLLSLFLLPAFMVEAQVDYYAQARQFLDEGNCEGAQTYYDLYRNSNPEDRDMEIAIAVCKGMREQEEECLTMTARFAIMKELYEALLSGDCEKASQIYLDLYANKDFEDQNIERYIVRCRQQKAESEHPMAVEEVFEVGNLEYYVYLNGISMAWSAANDAAKASKVNGHTDWRLPTVTELQIVLQHIDEKKYRYSPEGHWSSTKNGSYHRSVYSKTKIYDCVASDLNYCILVRTMN